MEANSMSWIFADTNPGTQTLWNSQVHHQYGKIMINSAWNNGQQDAESLQTQALPPHRFMNQYGYVMIHKVPNGVKQDRNLCRHKHSGTQVHQYGKIMTDNAQVDGKQNVVNVFRHTFVPTRSNFFRTLWLWATFWSVSLLTIKHCNQFCELATAQC